MSVEKATHIPSILDSELYQKPQDFLEQSISALRLPAAIKAKWDEYVAPFLSSEQNNPQDPGHQKRMKIILDDLIEKGMKEEAGLVLNMHRAFTKFKGYDPNYETSEDVGACFNDEMPIPSKGMIVVDHFVTRNLAAIVKYCKPRGLLDRILVRVPKGVWAVQIMGLSGAKKTEFEEACAELREDQFLIEDVNHVQDIKLKKKTAVLFSPRTGSIYPKLHANSERKTIKNYRRWIKQRISNLVPGGRMFANLAKVEDFVPPQAEVNEKELTKLTSSISDKVAQAILRQTNRKGATILKNGEFTLPEDYDHSKKIINYHVQKPESVRDRIRNRWKFWRRKKDQEPDTE
ncbi:hypothetical protein HN748_02755 [Candidatus Peregrinibacteria bacterium]|jgi:hypothetical protein|nr:hypothetical protein [Candidatus Peregrinibacteria bacterium]MBT7483844.1 hypothetical protein [Candidatus Peregrinibacteria bacterium]MBT7703128.1 hypothetical protein [Candidatus Peregrinibacteria bacterium]